MFQSVRPSYNGNTLAFQARAVSSILTGRSMCAFLAQLVERIHGKDEVAGSIPAKSTRLKRLTLTSQPFLLLSDFKFVKQR